MTIPQYTEIPDDGIDATHLVGSENDRAEEEAFARFQEAFAVATSHPSVNHFRACVRAYDDFRALFAGGGE